MERVGTLTTPGPTIDVVVTEEGIAVNPRRPDARERLTSAGLPCKDIADLQRLAQSRAERAPRRPVSDDIVAVSEYRDGTISDVIDRV